MTRKRWQMKMAAVASIAALAAAGLTGACGDDTDTTPTTTNPGGGGTGGAGGGTGGTVTGGGGTGGTAPSNITGTVTDPPGDGVADAEVVLVAAADVEDADSIQPMEDIAEAVIAGTNTNGYTTTTDANGDYTLAGVADGEYFLVVIPGNADTLHLPGAHRARDEVVSGAFVDATYADIEITQHQTDAATYVGSSTCLGCHAKTSLQHTLHFVGIRKIATNGSVVPSTLIDMASAAPYDLQANNDAMMAPFTNPATQYVLAGTPNGDTVFLGLDSGGPYFQVAANTNPKYYVKFTYGGETGKWKSRYVTLVTASDSSPAVQHGDLGGGDWGYFMMAPMQFQEKYTDGSNGVSGPFVAYHNDRWDFGANGNDGGGLFTSSPSGKSWDTNCAPCHGANTVTKNGNNFEVSFPADANGYTLEDGTSNTYEVNVGCERCHGPGSEHVAAGGNGKSIVFPDLLTAGRLTMICGSCHIRGDNNTGDVVGEPPLLSDGAGTYNTFRPGNNPATFFGTTDGGGIAPFETDALTTGFLSPINFLTNKASWKDISYETADPFVTTTAVGDRTQVTGFFNHSKGHHQQFQDLVRTKMYKNDRELLTCPSCHDAHGNDNEHQLQANADNNALCLSCHNDSMRTPAADEPTPDESKEGKHPANFQFITADMAAHLVAGTTTGAEDTAITDEVKRHMTKWTGGGMGSQYDPEGTGYGRCVKCHMAKTAKSASFSNALLVNGHQYLEGDIHSHTFDVVMTEAVNAMQTAVGEAATTPAGVTNGCATCHVAVIN